MAKHLAPKKQSRHLAPVIRSRRAEPEEESYLEDGEFLTDEAEIPDTEDLPEVPDEDSYEEEDLYADSYEPDGEKEPERAPVRRGAGRKRSALRETVRRTGRVTSEIGHFVSSRSDGLSAVTEKNTFPENVSFDMTDAITAGIAAVIGIVCLILRFGGIGAYILALAECALLYRKLFLPLLKNLKALSFFHAGVMLLVGMIGGFCTGNPQNAVLIISAYILASFLRNTWGERSEDEEAEPLEEIREVWSRGEERIVRVPVEEIHPGSYVYVETDHEIPFDGIIVQGTSKVDRHKLSRTIMSATVGEDDYVYAGDLNVTGQLCIKVLKKREDSLYYDVRRVQDRCDAEQSEKEEHSSGISEVLSRVFVFTGLFVIIGSLFFKEWRTQIQAAGICILLLSCTGVDYLPNLYRRWLGEAAARGAVFTSKNVFDRIRKTDTVAFDKTGIITETTFRLKDIRGVHPGKDLKDEYMEIEEAEADADRTSREKFLKAEVLKYAAAAEQYSVHPIAKFLKATVKDSFPPEVIQPVEEIPGLGIGAFVAGHLVYVGNERLMREHGIAVLITKVPGIVCHVSRDNQYLGYILLEEIVNPNAYEFTGSMDSLGVDRLAMLTGASASSSTQMTRDLSINMLKTELLPEDKVKTMEYLHFTKSADSELVYLNRGDNVFDIAAKADISVSVAGLEEHADLHAADIYLFHNDISVIPQIISGSKKAEHTAKQNRILLLGINAAAVILGVIGLIPTGAFALLHFGASIAVYFNTIRKQRS